MNRSLLIAFIGWLILMGILALRWALVDVDAMRTKEKARMEKIISQPDYRAEFLRRIHE